MDYGYHNHHHIIGILHNHTTQRGAGAIDCLGYGWRRGHYGGAGYLWCFVGGVAHTPDQQGGGGQVATVNAFLEMVISMAALSLLIPVVLLNMGVILRYWVSEED